MLAVSHEPTETLYRAPERVSKDSLVPNLETYLRLYRESLDEPERFWARMAGST